MSSQLDTTVNQTSGSLVEREDRAVQSGTNGGGPSTGQEYGRIGVTSPGTNESSATERRIRLKKVKMPGNDHSSLVKVQDEEVVELLRGYAHLAFLWRPQHPTAAGKRARVAEGGAIFTDALVNAEQTESQEVLNGLHHKWGNWCQVTHTRKDLLFLSFTFAFPTHL